jgi:hypothetical protein
MPELFRTIETPNLPKFRAKPSEHELKTDHSIPISLPVVLEKEEKEKEFEEVIPK